MGWIFYYHAAGIWKGTQNDANNHERTRSSESTCRTVSLSASPFLLSMYKYMTVDCESNSRPYTSAALSQSSLFSLEAITFHPRHGRFLKVMYEEKPSLI